MYQVNVAVNVAVAAPAARIVAEIKRKFTKIFMGLKLNFGNRKIF